MKKTLAFMLVLLMVFSLLPVTALAEGTAGTAYITVENTTYSTDEGAAWDGTLINSYAVDINTGDTMMDALLAALDANNMTNVLSSDSSAITAINGLAEFDAGTRSGFLGTLNGLLCERNFAAIEVKNGDEIKVMHSTSFGEDVGFSLYNEFSISEITVTIDGSATAGTIEKDKTYTVNVDIGNGSSSITPTVTLLEVWDGEDDIIIDEAKTTGVLDAGSAGTTSFSWTPSKSGACSLKALVTAEIDGLKTCTKNNTLSVTIEESTSTTAATPTFDPDLSTEEVTYTVNATPTDLAVLASVSDTGEVTYQWYSNTINSAEGGNPVGTGTSYTPSTANEGTTYYYVVATNTLGESIATATSKVATVTVAAAVLSGDAALDFTADTGTSLAGVVLTDDTNGESGEDEASAMPLSVTIAHEDAAAAVFDPVTDNAAVTAYADDGTGGGTYEAVAGSYDFSGTNTTLWIEVVSEDGNNTLYYKLTVTVAAQTREVKLYAYWMTYPKFEVYDSEGNQVDVTRGTPPRPQTPLDPYIINAAPGEYTYKYFNSSDELMGVGSFTVTPGTASQSIYFAILQFQLQTVHNGYQGGGTLLVTYEDGTELECHEKTQVTAGLEPHDGYNVWKYLVALDEGDNLFYYYYTALDDGLNSYESTVTVSPNTNPMPKTITRTIISNPFIDNTVRVTKGVEADLYNHPGRAYIPFIQLVEGEDYTVDRASDPDYDIYTVALPLQGIVEVLAGGEGTGYVKTAMGCYVADTDGFDETLNVNLKGEYARDNTVPPDAYMENDLYLTVDDSNYLLMNEGDTERLEAFRIWQTVGSSTTNRFIAPDFSYEIIGDSVTIEKGGVVGREYANITAVEPGVSIIKITYEPLITDGVYYDATDSENTRTVVINVGGSEGDIKPNIGQTEYDTIFFLDKLIGTDGTQTPGEGYAEYTFTPTSSSPLTVRVHDPLHNTAWGTGWTAYKPANDGSFTVRLKEGRNIIEMSNTAGAVSYYVVNAADVVVTAVNNSRPGKAVRVGDSVSVSFEGLKQPIQKMTAIYNPGYPSTVWVQYNTSAGSVVRSHGVQYRVIVDNSIEFIADEPGEFKLVNGCIHAEHLGSPLDSHRNIPGEGLAPNLSASTGPNSPYFSTLPDITIQVEGSQTAAEQSRFNYAQLTHETLLFPFYAWISAPVSGNWEDLNSARNIFSSTDYVYSFIMPETANEDTVVTARYRLPYSQDPSSQTWIDLGELPVGELSNITHSTLGSGIRRPGTSFGAPDEGFSKEINIVGDTYALIEVEITVTPDNPEDGYAQTYVWRFDRYDESDGDVASYLTGLTLNSADTNDVLIGTDGQLKAADGGNNLGYGFLMSQNEYTVTVPYDVDAITLTPTVRTDKHTELFDTNNLGGGTIDDVSVTYPAAVTVNGVSVDSGTASGSIPVGIGETVITVTTDYPGGSDAVPQTTTYMVVVNRDAASEAVSVTGMAEGAAVTLKTYDGRTVYPVNGAYQLTPGRSYTYYYSKPGYLTVVGTFEMAEGQTELALPTLPAIEQPDGSVTVRIAGYDGMLRPTTALPYSLSDVPDLAERSYVEYNHGGYTVLHALVDACTTGNYRVAFSCYKGNFVPEEDLTGSLSDGFGWVCEVNGEVVTDYDSTLVEDGDQIEFYFNASHKNMLHAWFNESTITLTQGESALVTLMGAPVNNNGTAAQPVADAELFIGSASVGATDANGQLTISSAYFTSPGSYYVTAVKTDDEDNNILTYSLCTIYVKKAPPVGSDPDKTIVTFRLVGAKYGEDTAQGYDNYFTWIPTTTCIFDASSVTVYDVFTQVLAENGLKWDETMNDYIGGIKAPASVGGYWLYEFDNGQNSGWMYTVNGSHPAYGLRSFSVTTGDVIVWHYVNDYMYEVEDWFYGTDGNNSTWSKWLAAPDVIPTGDNFSDSASASEGATATVTPTTTVTNGSASASVGKADIDAILDAAGTDGTTKIVIEAKTSQNVTKSTVTLPSGSVSDITNAGMSLTVETSTGTFDFDNDALGAIAGAGSGDITFSAEQLGTDDLSDANKELVGNHPVFDLSITVGDTKVTDFGDGAVLVSLPYTPADGEDTGNLTIYYLDENGNAVEMNGAYYDQATGCIVFATDHFSRFAVVYEAWTNPFTDVKSTDWFYSAVKYVAQNALFNGTTATTFGPDVKMSRAMFVTVLHRLDGKPAVTGTNGFADVKNGEWYTDAVIWADANSIVTGYDTGLFGTDDIVTREQMAVILYNYAKYKGYDVTKTDALAAFTDTEDVSSWALTAIKWAVAEGYITGTTTTTLSPEIGASRATVATILMRFAEDMAQ